MEVLSLAGFIAIVKIMIIDILLAGDNAIVIGLAAKNLPDDLRKKAIFWGTFGAIALRLIMALLFVEALATIPYLRIVGGILLLWIGYSFLKDDESEHNVEAKDNLRGAITTIIIADGIMGIDNVLGVVAAAEGHFGLVMAGMLISVPIIIWGSTFFITLIEKFPIILYVGGGILGWVSASMIVEDPIAYAVIGAYSLPFHIGCVALVLGAAYIRNKIVKK